MGFRKAISGLFTSTNGFTQLNEVIKSGNNEAVLDDDYKFSKKEKDYKSGLILDFNDFTLDGNNHVIDATDAYVIFKISGKNITFKNITFKNSDVVAWIESDANCNFINCKFEANNDAINVKNDGSCSLDNCNFNENSTSISLEKNGCATLVNCNFENNTIPLFNIGKLQLIDCLFLDNNSYSYNKNQLTIKNCMFSNNTSLTEKGLLINKGKLDIESSSFANNISVNLIKNESTLNIDDSSFKDNISQNSLCYNESICIINHSSFDNNSSNEEYRADMHNLDNAKLTLKEISISNDSPSILNQGEISTTFNDQEIEEKIHNVPSGHVSKIMGSIFSDLNKLIENATSNEIMLGNDYSLEENEIDLFKQGIKIMKDNLVVDGNGHMIDAMKIGGFLTIDGENITFKNITFKNAFSEESSSAININNACRFINCKFENTQGPLMANNHSRLELIKTEIVETEGIAINNDGGEITIDNSNFNKNHSASIRTSGGTVNIANCEIANNEHAIDCDNGNIIITKTNFSSNRGNLISSHESTVEISNCEFDSNEGKLKNISGRIKINNSPLVNNTLGIMNENDGQITMTDSQITNNSIDMKNKSGEISLNQLIFTENKPYEGISIITNEKGRVTVLECDFIKNSCNSQADKASVILNRSYVSITSSNFKNNRCHEIIRNDDIENGTLSLSNGKFIENTVSSSAIVNDGKSTSINKATFENNKLASGDYRDILNNGDLNFIEPKFKNNTKSVINYGKINTKKESKSKYERYIDNHGEIVDEVPPKEKRCDFSHLDELIHNAKDNDEIKLEKDITFGNYEVDYYEGGIEIDIDGLTIDGQGNTINGNSASRIFIITANNITLKNINFKNGFHHDSFFTPVEGGGLVKINSQLNVKFENCTFDSGFSDEEGGAIYNRQYSNCTICECEFNQNKSKDNGGAIVNEGEITLIRSTFLENSSKSIGGAISNYGKIDLSDISFKSNGIYDIDEKGDETQSGVIYNENTLNSSNATFEKNSGILVMNEESGIISLDHDKIHNNSTENDCLINNKGILDLSNVELRDNECAIMENTPTGKITLADSKLINNQANETLIKNCNEVNFSNTHMEGNVGRLIENEKSGQMTLDAILLKNNTTSEEEYEGIIINSGKIDLSNSRIISNSSKKGVIYNSDNGNIDISNSEFENNGSQSSGPAIYNNDYCVVNLKNSKMDNNRNCITNNGELHIHSSQFNNNENTIFNMKTLRVHDSRFENNSSNFGAAIDCKRANTIIKNTVFENNHATNGGSIRNTDGGPMHSGVGPRSCTEGIILIENCKFNNNSADSKGGAIFNNEDGVLIVEDSNFSNNQAETGGAIYSIHAEMNYNKNRLELINCRYSSNQPDNIYTDAVISNNMRF